MRTTEDETRRASNTMLKKLPDVMTVDQLAKVLHISKKTCYQLLQSGKIESIRIGRVYRIPKIKAFKYLLELEPVNH